MKLPTLHSSLMQHAVMLGCATNNIPNGRRISAPPKTIDSQSPCEKARSEDGGQRIHAVCCQHAKAGISATRQSAIAQWSRAVLFHILRFD